MHIRYKDLILCKIILIRCLGQIIKSNWLNWMTTNYLILSIHQQKKLQPKSWSHKQLIRMQWTTIIQAVHQLMVQNCKPRNHLVIQIYHQWKTTLHRHLLQTLSHHVSLCRSLPETMERLFLLLHRHQKPQKSRRRSFTCQRLLFQLRTSTVTVMPDHTVYWIQWTWLIVSIMTNFTTGIKKSRLRDLLGKDCCIRE